jgi:Methyltransferase domain
MNVNEKSRFSSRGNIGSNEAYCRLCGGRLLDRFKLKVLRKYDVQYYECKTCHSLQTEKPYWLDEAYNQTLSSLDTGAAQRNLLNLGACYAISKLFKVRNAIDFGGGDGILCRLMRDQGINCFVKDKYAQPTYAQGFTEPDFTKPDLVVAFEVLEHFSNPMTDLDELFSLDPNILLVTTAIYTNEEKDWWYLAPEGGQHVFFYSRNSLDLIAVKYEYKLIICSSFILFVKSSHLTPTKLLMAKLLLKGKICRLIKSAVVLLPAPGVWKDHARISKGEKR